MYRKSFTSLLSLITTVAASGALCVTAQAVPAHTKTAELLVSKLAYASPGSRTVVRGVSDHTPIYGAPTTLPVLSEAGPEWLHVALWGRPNGTTGWITSAATREGQTPWVIRVSLPARTVKVYHLGHLIRTMKAVIGSPETPTPTGHFFIVEKVPQPNGSSIGPWALALNGYSNVLHQFGGGPGQIAIHGIGNLGASPGEAASHGCIRLTTANLDWLARRVSSGVTVAISGPSAVTAKASYMPAEPATVSLTIKSAENNMAENIFSNPFSPFFSTD